MDFYWDLSDTKFDSTALVDSDGRGVSYSELNLLVNECRMQLPLDRSLVLLKCSNQLSVIVWYLACLQANHPLILVDSELSDELLEPLIKTYKPNIIIQNNYIDIRHKENLDLNPKLALMLSTSGTTGSPKLVRLSKENLQSNAQSIAEYLQLTAEEVAITTMPLNYSYGLSILNSHLLVGAKLVVTSSTLLSRDFWQLVKEHKVTSLSGVPYIWQMLRKMRFERFDTSSIKYLTQAGGRLDSDSLNYYFEKTKEAGQKFFVMYGQTEATARISYLPPEMLAAKCGSIGIAIPGGKLWIKTPSGQITDSFSELGELVYQGPNVMLGYAEQLSDLALGDINNGWLYTGDLGYCDNDGFFYITGRVKRFIKIFGLRISLDAVDELLTKKGFTAVSAGRDDKLYIFVEDKLASNNEIALFVAETLKVNVNAISVHYVDTIPRTSNGKIDGQALRSLMENYE